MSVGDLRVSSNNNEQMETFSNGKKLEHLSLFLEGFLLLSRVIRKQMSDAHGLFFFFFNNRLKKKPKNDRLIQWSSPDAQ